MIIENTLDLRAHQHARAYCQAKLSAAKTETERRKWERLLEIVLDPTAIKDREIPPAFGTYLEFGKDSLDSYNDRDPTRSGGEEW